MGVWYTTTVLFGMKCKAEDIFEITKTTEDKTKNCGKDSGRCPMRARPEANFCPHCGEKRSHLVRTVTEKVPRIVLQEFFGTFDPDKMYPDEWRHEVAGEGRDDGICILDEGGYSDGETLYVGLPLSTITPREGGMGQVSLKKIEEIRPVLLDLAEKLGKPLALYHFTQAS